MSPRLKVGRANAVSLTGLEGHMVRVEGLIQDGLPGFTLVGLPDAALGEARDRVRAAFASAGFAFPQTRVTVNLSPAYLPKCGTGFDLAIAAALLTATRRVDPAAGQNTVLIGELSLDGRIRPVRGVLPAVAAAVAAGYSDVVVPAACQREAALVAGANPLGIESLEELAWRWGAGIEPPPPDRCASIAAGLGAAPEPVEYPDLADVVGQAQARYALEVAAAGGHHILMQGPPGTGKTMLAARLPGLLPQLDEAQAVEVTALHSVAGTFNPDRGLITRPPFQDPHHTATPAALVGGGSGIPRPGAASLAHRGVLFLDECPEFSPRALQTLRQPLERGEVVIHRANGAARYPARFHLVLAANPCPCGRGWGRGEQCSCTATAKRRYMGRLSGPLLDRIDLVVDVDPVAELPLGQGPAGESSAAVAARVAAARAEQRRRYAEFGWLTNAEVPGTWLRGRLGAGSAIHRQLNQALEMGLLSMRGVDRVLRVAWTMADLAGFDSPTPDQVDQAICLRVRAAI
ncbi:MAG: YifB family Mg chelatase-like AAA ATPase [Bifidobacteriaceae bacterium]|jgi:magnesium chelatase family protein|nr:YifB family Mg chelatase-like AAA ATPase [Bifidobacteriaceae bacterium]